MPPSKRRHALHNTVTSHCCILFANFHTIGSKFESLNCIWKRQLDRNNLVLGKENKSICYSTLSDNDLFYKKFMHVLFCFSSLIVWYS